MFLAALISASKYLQDRVPARQLQLDDARSATAAAKGTNPPALRQLDACNLHKSRRGIREAVSRAEASRDEIVRLEQELAECKPSSAATAEAWTACACATTSA
jgi:hypothetical protein